MTSRRVTRPPSSGGLKSNAGWPLLAVLVLGMVGVAAAWFAFSGSFADDDKPVRQHRYVEAVVGAPFRINPLFAHLNDADRDITSLVFSGLTRLGRDGAVLP